MKRLFLVLLLSACASQKQLVVAGPVTVTDTSVADQVAAASEPASQPSSIPNPLILVFAMRGCPACAELLIWLDANNIPYKVVDVEAGLNFYASYGLVKCIGAEFQAVVPISFVNGDIIYGFDPEAFQKSMAHEVLPFTCK